MKSPMRTVLVAAIVLAASIALYLVATAPLTEMLRAHGG